MPPANTVVDMGLSHYVVQQLPRASGIRSLLPSAAGGQRGSAAWRGGAGPCQPLRGCFMQKTSLLKNFAESNFFLLKAILNNNLN